MKDYSVLAGSLGTPRPKAGEPVSALDRITVNAAELTRQADVARSLMARFAASPSTPAEQPQPDGEGASNG